MFKYNVVNEKMKEEGRTREWLSAKCVVPRGSMSQYLTGHRQPSLDVISRISVLLDIHIHELIGIPEKATG